MVETRCKLKLNGCQTLLLTYRRSNGSRLALQSNTPTVTCPMRDVSSWEIVIYADKKPQSSALNTTLISLVLRQKDTTLRYNCSRNDAPLRIDPLAILVESIHHQANHLMPSWRLQFFPSLTFFLLSRESCAVLFWISLDFFVIPRQTLFAHMFLPKFLFLCTDFFLKYYFYLASQFLVETRLFIDLRALSNIAL